MWGSIHCFSINILGYNMFLWNFFPLINIVLLFLLLFSLTPKIVNLFYQKYWIDKKFELKHFLIIATIPNIIALIYLRTMNNIFIALIIIFLTIFILTKIVFIKNDAKFLIITSLWIIIWESFILTLYFIIINTSWLSQTYFC